MELVALRAVGENMAKVRGFTLIELLVTLAVAIIIMTIAVPSFHHMMAVSHVASDHNVVLSGLNYARSHQKTQRCDVYSESTRTLDISSVG